MPMHLIRVFFDFRINVFTNFDFSNMKSLDLREILDCPSGAYIFNVLISGMVRNYEMFL